MDFNRLADSICEADRRKLAELASVCRRDILTMTTVSGSGHPGGSMSAIDILLALYAVANVRPDNVSDPERDRIVVSNGHISPAVYACLAENGFIPRDEALALFRKAGSPYEGHIERLVPGVEWTTGNLGQGLSAACGMAVAGRTLGQDFDIYVVMGDGEQEKGQIAEARRFAKKYDFDNITVFIDYNRLQISGDIREVMPSLDIAAGFKADGWLVLEIDGHDYDDILGAILKAKSADAPVAVIAHTVMGRGVSFMENKCGFHGSTLSEDRYAEAVKDLGFSGDLSLDEYKTARKEFEPDISAYRDITPIYKAEKGEPIFYGADVVTDNRSAFGRALESVTAANANGAGTPVVVFDCDLAGSVKTDGIRKNYPGNFYQCGIAEHHASVCAGAASVNGVISFFADFGMFGVDEVYNQQRLNGINDAALKLVTTHVGVDVGEDGKTHMCVDYLGLIRNIFGFKAIVPADPNETDRAVRYAASERGNVHIAMGRSKIPVVTDEKGEPFFSVNKEFEYGRPDVVREGDFPLFVYGAMVHRALKIRDILKNEGVSVAVINVSSPVYIKDEYLEKFFDAGLWFSYEDHIPSTGLGATLSEKIVSSGKSCRLVTFGVKRFPFSGTPDEVLKLMGLDEESVAAGIKKAIIG